MNINLKQNVLEWQIYYYKFYKKFIKNIQFFKGEFLFKEKFLYYYSMNNNLTFSYNNKVYKTEAAMKKAKTMDAKRASKQAKREAYAVSEKAFKRQQTDFSKQLLKIGSIYDEEKKKEIKINRQENRKRKAFEKGQALGTFKVVSYYDNLHYKEII